MSNKVWTATCFMGSDIGYQEVTVQASTIVGAEKMIRQIYNPEFIQDLREDGSYESPSGIGCSGFFLLPLVIGFVVSLMGGSFVYGLVGGFVLYFMIR